MLDLETIGKRIAVKRKELNITQNTLAEQLYVTHQAVSKWENGKSIPSLEILYELTKLFEISIDYLLDDTDIADNDYETLFKNYPRDIVINKFLKKEDFDIEIPNIFYLLNKNERFQIINQILSKSINLDVKYIWPYLNPKERILVLGIILSGKCDYNLLPIYTQLSLAEQLIVQKHLNKGTYNYKLPNIL
jgi:transcriptional regulator with XRE-family HTH domain